MKATRGIYDHSQQFLMFEKLESKKVGMGVLFFWLVSSGLRLSDSLTLTPSQIRVEMTVKESNTGKMREIKCTPQLVCLIGVYAARERIGEDNKIWPWSRQTVHRHFVEAAKSLGLADFSPHAARKMFGWHVLHKTEDFDAVKNALNHAFLSTTMIYLADGIMWGLDKIYPDGFRGIEPCL
jgi:integrase